MNVNQDAVDFWVGVDLSQDSLQVSRAPAGLDVATWQRLPQAGFANTPAGHRALAGWIAEQAKTLRGACRGIVVEATGGLSRRLAESLEKPGDLPRISIVNPFFVKTFGQSLGQRSKNDKLDAAVLAVFGAVHKPAPAAQRSAAQERLRELDRLRQGIVEQRTAWNNSRREMRDRAACRIADQQIKLAAQQIKNLNGQIDRTIDEDDDLRRQRRLLDSLPGIGPCVAATILAELGDLKAYRRDELVSYAGLYSRERRSGKRQGRGGGLVKGGGARIRRALALAAMAIRRSKNAIKEFDRRLLDRGKSKMCALGAMMRKLLIIARAVIISGQAYDPDQALRAQHPRKPAVQLPA